MCELCDNILQDKYKREENMMKKFFLIQEEFIDVFHENIYILTIENFHFVLLVLVLLVQCNVGILEVILS